MVVILPRISFEEHASEVVKEIKSLLRQRHHKKISRKQFLSRYSALRVRLYATEEYQAFKRDVRVRARGRCENCSNAGAEVHHKKPVAAYPALATNASNGKLLCLQCHKAEHASSSWNR